MKTPGILFVCLLSGRFLTMRSQTTTPSAVPQRTMVCWSRVDPTVNSGNIHCLSGDPYTWIYNLNRGDAFSLYYPNGFGNMYIHMFALGFNYGKRDLYFSAMLIRELEKVTLTSSSSLPVVTVYEGLSSQVYGIALDWTSEVLYWTDATYNCINAAFYIDGTYIYKRIISTGLYQPVGIAVYPSKGYLYWTDWGGQPSIKRADLDGKNTIQLIAADLVKPLSLTIDYQHNLLLWVDGLKPAIEISDLLGNNRKLISMKSQASPFGIAVYQDLIFVTEINVGQVEVYNRTHGSLVSRIDHGIVPYDIIVYDATAQPLFSVNCSSLNCGQMCVNTPSGAKCMCADGYIVLSNGTCQELPFTEPVFIFTIDTAICASHVAFTTNTADPAKDVSCFVYGVNQTQAVAVDVRGNQIYYSDAVSKFIYRTYIDLNKRFLGSDGEIIARDVGNVLGIAVSSVGELLYWTDNTLNHIMVSKYDGSFPRTLIENVIAPRKIAVDFNTAKIFWTSSSGIFTATMNGQKVTKITLSPVSNPFGLAIHRTNDSNGARLLFWTNNQKQSSIGFRDLDNYKYLQLNVNLQDSHNVKAIAIFEDTIAWIDGDMPVIHYSTYNDNNASATVVTTLQYNGAHLYDIVAFGIPIPYLNPCSQFNGDCDQLCIINDAISFDYSCQCGDGYTLGDDQSTCTPADSTVFPTKRHPGIVAAVVILLLILLLAIVLLVYGVWYFVIKKPHRNAPTVQDVPQDFNNPIYFQTREETTYGVEPTGAWEPLPTYNIHTENAQVAHVALPTAQSSNPSHGNGVAVDLGSVTQTDKEMLFNYEAVA